MPSKNRKKNNVKPKVEKPKTSLADEILNGTPPVEEGNGADFPYREYKMTPVMEDSPSGQGIVEPIQEVAKKAEPEVAQIPVIKANPYDDQNGVRFYDRSLAGRTAHGSVGHDLIFDVLFDENGLSEFVTDEKVIDKLLRCGFKVFKA